MRKTVRELQSVRGKTLSWSDHHKFIVFIDCQATVVCGKRDALLASAGERRRVMGTKQNDFHMLCRKKQTLCKPSQRNVFCWPASAPGGRRSTRPSSVRGRAWASGGLPYRCAPARWPGCWRPHASRTVFCTAESSGSCSAEWKAAGQETKER